MNKQEALLKAQELAAIGYELLPADNMFEAKHGIVAFRVRRDSLGNCIDKDSVTLEWPMFTENTSVTITDCTGEELLEFMSSQDGKLCDNPRLLKMGYMKYDPSNDRVQIRMTYVSKMRNESRDVLNTLNKLRTEIRTKETGLATGGVTIPELAAISAAAQNAPKPYELTIIKLSSAAWKNDYEAVEKVRKLVDQGVNPEDIPFVQVEKVKMQSKPNMITVFKVGDENHLPSVEDIKQWKQMIQESSQDPDFKVFTSSQVSVETIELGDKILVTSGHWTII